MYTDSNVYLVPSSDYYWKFVETLHFNDVHECLWGSNEEIRQYLPKLFEVMCKEAQEHSNRLGGLLNDIKQNRPLRIPNNFYKQLYAEIKDDLWNEWSDFTRAKSQDTITATVIGFEKCESYDTGFTIVDKVEVRDSRDTILGEFLGLRDIDVALKNFIDTRVTKLAMRQLPIWMR